MSSREIKNRFGPGMDAVAIADVLKADLQDWAQAEAKAALRNSLKGTMAGKLTQQDVLDAFGRIPAEYAASATVWLQLGVNPPVELVDYQLVPVGPESTLGAPVTLDRPMALKRAESGSLTSGLPLREALWLLGADVVWHNPNMADIRSVPVPRLVLSVRRDYGPNVAPKPGPAPVVKAQRAVDRIQYEPGIEQLTELVARDLTARTGQKPEFWVFKHYKNNSLPMLHVLKGSERRAAEWAELYARLVLGEEVEDT